MNFLRKTARPLAPETGWLTHNGGQIAYTVIRSRRRRRTVALSVKPGAGLRILAPMRISQREIGRLLHRRADWIVHQFMRLQHIEHVQAQTLDEGMLLPYLGGEYILGFGLFARVVENKIEINPAKNLHAALTAFYKNAAQDYLQTRIDMWTARLGVNYRAFKLSNAKRQWGCCSGRNEISINWRIIMAPPEVIDYLLVHELCHIPHKNHGFRFWHKVARALPDYKARQKILRGLENDLLVRLR